MTDDKLDKGGWAEHRYVDGPKMYIVSERHRNPVNAAGDLGYQCCWFDKNHVFQERWFSENHLLPARARLEVK